MIDFTIRDHSTTARQIDLYYSIPEAENALKDFFGFRPYFEYPDHHWHFVPKLKLNNIDLVWRPILSDYLFAFVLSTILRYHPYLFYKNPKDNFIGEAWCSQAAITTLRQFLMSFTNPSLRLNA
ncbi:hypothetical protein [Flagellimonas lutimaris]|uniref:hypothetical protein n=1 Tax=Flagellimonas lutimaris TaxID=475082 RepID=UPI0011C3D441|nr:hypothetical protein [Allomuricauda lutimaris]